MLFGDHATNEFRTHQLENLFDEVLRSLRPFTDARKIKQKIEGDLKELKIDEEDLADFKLATMEVLLSLKANTSIEVFLKTAFNGCIDAMLCSVIVAKTSSDKQVSSMAYSLGSHFQETLSIMAHFLKVMRLSAPNVRAELSRFETEVEPNLVPLTEAYLKAKEDYHILRGHEQDVKTFRMVTEIMNAVVWLRHVLEEQRHALGRLKRTEERFVGLRVQ